MADHMGDQDLELASEGAKDEVDEGYVIKHHPASLLPEEYKNLIRAPFLNSLRYGNDLYKLIDKDAYYISYGKYIEHLLQRPRSIVTLAILDDNTVLGWSLYEGETVHYVWVKKEVRRQGIAKELLPDKFSVITHITNTGINIWVNKFPLVRFNPFA
jgi:GNAT superfamily N-acetyltransferase